MPDHKDIGVSLTKITFYVVVCAEVQFERMSAKKWWQGLRVLIIDASAFLNSKHALL
jgi:hypothetical protein